MSLCLVLVPNHPAFYPHVARHASALRTLFDRVVVVAVFALGDELPKLDGVEFVCGATSFPAGVRGFFQWMKSIHALVRMYKADAVEAIDPPCLIPAALALRGRNTSLVYFSMEIFSQTPALAKRPLRRTIWSMLERLAVRRASRVLTVNESVAKVLEHQLHQSRVGVVRSVPPRQNHVVRSGILRQQLGLNADDFLLVYQGHLEPGRGLEPVIEFMHKRPHMHFVILGFGPLQTWCEEQAKLFGNVHYAGAHPFPQLMALAADADAGLVWIAPLSESYRLSLPGKVFEYTQNGLPILGSSLPEISRVIQEYTLGEVSSDWSETAFLQSLDALQVGISQGKYRLGLERAKQELCWEVEQNSLLAAFGED